MTRTEHFVKFGLLFLDTRADRQTDRHADRNTSHSSSRIEVKIRRDKEPPPQGACRCNRAISRPQFRRESCLLFCEKSKPKLLQTKYWWFLNISLTKYYLEIVLSFTAEIPAKNFCWDMIVHMQHPSSLSCTVHIKMNPLSYMHSLFNCNIYMGFFIILLFDLISLSAFNRWFRKKTLVAHEESHFDITRQTTKT